MKQENGLRLIREVPINVVGDFVSICSLICSPTYDVLDNFVLRMNEIFINKWDYLNQEDFSFFLAQLSR